MIGNNLGNQSTANIAIRPRITAPKNPNIFSKILFPGNLSLRPLASLGFDFSNAASCFFLLPFSLPIRACSLAFFLIVRDPARSLSTLIILEDILSAISCADVPPPAPPLSPIVARAPPGLGTIPVGALGSKAVVGRIASAPPFSSAA